MSTNLAENQDLRRYLLGQLTNETALQQIEERILEEADFQEEMAVAESALLDEYVLDALAEGEIAPFEQHFLAHPSRREQLRLARALHAYAQENQLKAATPDAAQPERPTRRWFDWLFLPPVRVAACAVLLLAVGVGIWRTFIYQSAIDQGLAQLRRAYPQEGPLDVRVTELPYGPPHAATRGDPTHSGDAIALRLAENKLLEAMQIAPNAHAYHALGRFYLTQKKYDEAIKQLETALKTNPDNAQLHADLGATLLAKAETIRDQKDGREMGFLGRSLEHLSQAIKLDSNLLEPRFNRALCLQRLQQPGNAQAAWEDYLRRDANSAWAERAKEYLQLLTGPQADLSTPEQSFAEFLKAYQQQDDERAWQIISQTREMITGRMVAFQLTRKFLEAVTQGRRDEAADMLAALNYAGKLERNRGGDPFVADLASYYARTDNNQQVTLKQAQQEMDSGYLECRDNDAFTIAHSHFVQARNLFSQAGDICEARVADFWVAYANSLSIKIQQTIGELQQLADFCKSKKYKWLAAQALGWIGDSYTVSNEVSKALTVQHEALGLAEQVSDTYNQQKLLIQFSLLYNQLGQPERALSYIQETLHLSGLRPIITRQAWRNFTFVSGTFYRLKNYYAAATFEEEALRLSQDKLHDWLMPYTNRSHLASIYTELQRYEEAKREAEASLQIAESLQPAEPARKQLVARAHLGLGDLLRLHGQPQEALTHYDIAIQLYDQMEFTPGKYEAHKGKLSYALSHADDQTAQAELQYVLTLLDKNRQTIKEARNRDSFFSGEQGVYELAINYEYERHNYPQAFAYAEAVRARSLLDALQNGIETTKPGSSEEPTLAAITNPFSLTEVCAQMPPGVQAVQYSVLQDKLLIWFISAGRYEVAEKKINQAELEAQITAYLAAIKTSTKRNVTAQNTINAQAATLYDVLLGPVAKWLDPARDLCIIPDKSLAGLPFAALMASPDGNYLVKDFRLFYAPSASSLILLSQKAKQFAPAGGESLLAIGNPTFNRKAYPDLNDLPESAQEAQAIARDNYRNPVLLLGAQARQERVKTAIGQAEVLHFACHYVTDKASPLRSRLLLADDGEFPVAEVLRTKFRNTKLVTLSACGTNTEYDVEGLTGLSRAFLAADVPLVVASQWPIAESEATVVLMTKFHHYRATERKTTNEALRLAQLDMLTYQNGRYGNPYYWAAFLPLGGYANF